MNLAVVPERDACIGPGPLRMLGRCVLGSEVLLIESDGVLCPETDGVVLAALVPFPALLSIAQLGNPALAGRLYRTAEVLALAAEARRPAVPQLEPSHASP